MKKTMLRAAVAAFLMMSLLAVAPAVAQGFRSGGRSAQRQRPAYGMSQQQRGGRAGRMCGAYGRGTRAMGGCMRYDGCMRYQGCMRADGMRRGANAGVCMIDEMLEEGVITQETYDAIAAYMEEAYGAQGARRAWDAAQDPDAAQEPEAGAAQRPSGNRRARDGSAAGNAAQGARENASEIEEAVRAEDGSES